MLWTFIMPMVMIFILRHWRFDSGGDPQAVTTSLFRRVTAIVVAVHMLLLAAIIHMDNDWLVLWNIFFPYIGNVIIPTDEVHHFSEG